MRGPTRRSPKPDGSCFAQLELVGHSIWLRTNGNAKMRYAISARSSGLGDMINQLMHIRWFAEQTGRTCLVDWVGSRHYLDDGMEQFDFFTHCFRPCSIKSVSSIDLSQTRIWPGFQTRDQEQNLENLYLLVEPKVVEDFAITGNDPQIDTLRFVRSIDFLPLDKLRPFYNELSPTEQVIERVEKLEADLCDCVGVHVRHGNGELYDRQAEGILLTRYEKAIRQEMHRSPSTARFFLATDSPRVEDWFLRTFGHFARSGKYLPGYEGCALHYPNSTLGRNVSRKGIMEDALVDMIALSRCSKLICDTWSSFTRATQVWGNMTVENGKLVGVKVPRKPFLLNREGIFPAIVTPGKDDDN